MAPRSIIEMDDKKANIIAFSILLLLITVIVVARVTLKLSKPFFLITGADVAAILAILSFILLRHNFNRRRRLVESQLVSEGRELRIEYSFLRKVAGVPIKFREKDLELATDNFQSLIGRGASASVFKGVLTDGTSVAVKRIDGEERGEREFRSEVAAIASVQHFNLVHLLGYCIVPGGSRFLVYDFIPNGSLDKWIFGKKNEEKCYGHPRSHHQGYGHAHRLGHVSSCKFLNWELRYGIAVDVAKALSYLHHDCRSRILHLDVKPENILLDQNYRALVSDFGLSRLMGKDESRIFSTIRGTRGYLAPEWLLEHGVSEKSDIYSFGMVILEMIGGRRNVSLIDNGADKSKRTWEYFPKIANEKRKAGKFMEIVDRGLIEHGGVDEKEVRSLLNVAFWCIQEKARLRPTMSRVVDMLEGRVLIDDPPDTPMIVVDLLCMDSDDDQRYGPFNWRRNGAAFAVNRLDEDAPSTSTCPSFAISVVSGR